MDSLVNYKLITNEIRLSNNKLPKGAFSIDPKINRSIDVIDDTHSSVTYVLEIKNTPEHPFPIDILVSVTGIFDISCLNEKDVDDFLKIQSCQIIFPNIRTIVATLTASSLMPPILLPVIDARKLFGESEPVEKT